MCKIRLAKILLIRLILNIGTSSHERTPYKIKQNERSLSTPFFNANIFLLTFLLNSMNQPITQEINDAISFFII